MPADLLQDGVVEDKDKIDGGRDAEEQRLESIPIDDEKGSP